MMSLWDALRMNMMISYQELVRTFLRLAAWHKVAGRKHEITPEIIILGFILQTPSGKRYKINKIIIFIAYLILFKEYHPCYNPACLFIYRLLPILLITKTCNSRNAVSQFTIQEFRSRYSLILILYFSLNTL